jgi:hypothetical protein
VPVATDRLEAAIGGDRSAVLVAEEDQRLVGFATIYLDLVSASSRPDSRARFTGGSSLDDQGSSGRDDRGVAAR